MTQSPRKYSIDQILVHFRY